MEFLLKWRDKYQQSATAGNLVDKLFQAWKITPECIDPKFVRNSWDKLQIHLFFLDSFIAAQLTCEVLSSFSVHRWHLNRIGGVMVSLLASSVVYRGFAEPRSGQTKVYEIGICCFSTKHTALRRKSKDWLAQTQNNVSKWSDISTRALLFQ